MPRLRRPDGYSARAGRDGNQHPDNAARRDDGQGCAQRASGRRDSVQSLVRKLMIDAETQRRGGTTEKTFISVFSALISASQRLCVERLFQGLNYVENW